jgi:hypothetical protein
VVEMLHRKVEIENQHFKEGSEWATDGGFTKLVGGFPYPPPEGVQKGGRQIMTGLTRLT